jgi:hypothetical protein
MTSIIPADLLDLKTRFETWRANRKYVREPIPDELWNAAADLSRRYPTSLVGKVLKLDPGRLKKLLTKGSARTSVRKKPQAFFLQLPTESALKDRLRSYDFEIVGADSLIIITGRCGAERNYVGVSRE